MYCLTAASEEGGACLLLEGSVSLLLEGSVSLLLEGFVVAFEHAEKGGITPERIGEQPAERQQQAEQHPPPHPSLGFEFAELFLGEEGGDRPKEADGDHRAQSIRPGRIWAREREGDADDGRGGQKTKPAEPRPGHLR